MRKKNSLCSICVCVREREDKNEGIGRCKSVCVCVRERERERTITKALDGEKVCEREICEKASDYFNSNFDDE